MIRGNWIPIAGIAGIKDDGITYISDILEKHFESNEHILTQPLVTILGSNIDFENGQINLKVVFCGKGNPKCSCQVIFNSNTDLPQLFVGVNNLGLFSIQRRVNNKFESFSFSGYSHSLKIDTEYDVKINIDGSVVKLLVNDVLVANTSQANIKKSQLQLLLSGECDIVVKELNVIQEKSKAFVVMQFTEEFNNLYTQVIKPICNGFDMECIRADECNNTGLILNDIIESIKEASIIIADITPNNPNVFYEVGYAHAINKPTILLSDRKREKLPFDVSGFRTIFYDNTIPGKTNIEKNLIKILENITSVKYKSKD